MDQDAAEANLAGFRFPTMEEQLGPQWLGGETQSFLKEVADFLVEQGSIHKARESYESAVDTRYLEMALGR